MFGLKKKNQLFMALWHFKISLQHA